MLGAVHPVLTKLPTTQPWKFLLCCWGSGFWLYQLPSSSVPPTLLLQSIHPSPKWISFYYVHVPLTFLSLESITSPWGIFPPEGKPFFCLVIWIYVCLNGVSCSSDSPQIYYVGEDDCELPILRPFPPVTAGITGILYHSQPTTAFSINLFLLLTVLA